MKRSSLHLLVDILMAIGGVGVLASGLLIWLILPAGSRDASVWGWTRHGWGDLHLYLALGVVALLLVHLALNWGWVCSVVLKAVGRSGRAGGWRRQSAGVGALCIVFLLVAGFLAAAAVAKQDAAPRERAWRHAEAAPASH